MREFVVRPVPLLTPVQAAERTLLEVLSQTAVDQGTLMTFRGMPGSGVDRVLQTALEYARGHEWLEYFFGLVEWERELPYSALERVCLKMEGLRHLLPDLVPDHDPIELGRRVLEALDAHFRVDERPLLMVFDHVEHCDPLSSIVFRYIVMRSTARGANFVLGDSLAYPADLGGELRQVVYTEPHAHLVILPELSAADIATYVGQEAGTRVAVGEGERVRRLTGGRYDAVRAYLNSVSDEHLADLAAIRTLPSVTSARMSDAPEPVLEALPETTRLAAEVCALQPDGVSMQMLKLVSNRLDVPFAADSAVDDLTVVMNSLTGMLHLYDPLRAPDILERTDSTRLRVIHSALADLTFGNESRIHSLLAAPELDDQAVRRVLDSVAELESAGEGQDALELLDVAVGRAQREPGGEARYRELLRRFGHVFLRQLSPVQYQERLGDFAKYADEDLEFAFMYLWLRSVKAHGRLEARDIRVAYMSAAPESVDHEFMQAEIALMEFLAAVQTGPDAIPEALENARQRYTALIGRTAPNPELRWLDPRSRLLLVEALALVFALSTGALTGVDVKVQALLAEARELADDSAEAVDVLTLAGLVLGGLGHIEEATEIVEAARRRLANLTRSPLLNGQLDVLDLDLAVRRGDWRQLHLRIGGAFDRAFDGLDMPTRIAVPSFKAWLLAVSGDLDEAERFLEVAKQSDRYRYPGFAIDMLAVAEAVTVRLRRGNSAALEVLEKAAAEPRFQASLKIRALRLELLAAEGRFAEAAEVWGEIEHLEALFGKHGSLANAWRGFVVEAAQGDLDSALERIERGAAHTHSTFELGKCHLARGHLTARLRGRCGAAKEYFEKARDAFTAIGANAYADEAIAQLREVASAKQERLNALTPRERQVATLAARGWRNKEIARELNIGVATVAFHMSNALEKLDVARRSELRSVIE